MTRDVRRRWAALMLIVASGFAGLGYQIVWTQQCALWLGHESAAILAVVTAFFGGLAVGALALGGRIEKSRRPVRWYAGCELVVALWSLVLVFAMAPVSTRLLSLTGAESTPLWQWSVAFCGTFLLLLPATAAMGGTLPAMERLSAGGRGESRSIAALYAGNTFGAVVGVLSAAFWLVPALGLARTAVVCAGLNGLCALMALAVFPFGPQPIDQPRTPVHDSRTIPVAGNRPRATGVSFRLALTGLLGIGYEVVVVRVLSQVTENTVYTFAVVLAVYLLGTTAGAAGYERWLSSRRASREPDARPDDALLGLLAAASLAGTATLWMAEQTRALARHALGGSMMAAIAAEAFPALLAFGPPTVVMGALFSHLSRRAHASGLSFGEALGVNTLGAMAAPAAFGVLVYPALGPKVTLVLIAAVYMGLMSRRSWRRPAAWVPAAVASALASFAPALAFVDVPAGGRIVRYEDGAMAAVSVVEDESGVARLRINNRQQEGSSATKRVDGRQAWLPLALHSRPGHVLFLGLGTGMTAAAAAEDPTLEVDAVELLPEVIRASTYFTHGRAEDPATASRLHVHAADARRYVHESQRRYDVIVSDNFHPARSGSGSLYTVEHFAAVKLRLTGDGVFCQWLPLHQMDLVTLRSIVQAFLAVYPRGWALIASNSLETPVLGLVGRRDSRRFDVAAVRARLASVASPARLQDRGLEDELAVLGTFVAGPAALRRFAGDVTANDDDHPVVAYRAPRLTYGLETVAPDTGPRDRLIALLRELSIDPTELVEPSPEAAFAGRLAAYFTARNRFIESGRDVRLSPRVEDMLAQVREPLLSVLRVSPEFRPAYDPLLAMANAIARSDAPGARLLLTELTLVQPARPEATEALLRLPSGQPP